MTTRGLQTHDADFMVSIADRGADTLASSGRIGADLAGALKAEARRRVDEGSFFGRIAYASLALACSADTAVTSTPNRLVAVEPGTVWWTEPASRSG